LKGRRESNAIMKKIEIAVGMNLFILMMFVIKIRKK